MMSLDFRALVAGLMHGPATFRRRLRAELARNPQNRTIRDLVRLLDLRGHILEERSSLLAQEILNSAGVLAEHYVTDLAAVNKTDQCVLVWARDPGIDPDAHIQRVIGDFSVIMDLALAADGRLFGAAQYGIRVWDTATGEEIAEWDIHDGWTGSIAIRAAGDLGASAADDGVRVWSTADGGVVAEKEPFGESKIVRWRRTGSTC